MSEVCSIQAPSIGRVVVFTVSCSESASVVRDYEKGTDRLDRVVKIDCCPGIVVKVHGDGVVDIVTFGQAKGAFGTPSTALNNGVRYDSRGRSGTWAYPAHCADKIDVAIID